MKKTILLIITILISSAFVYSDTLEISPDDQLIITVHVWGQVQNPGEYKIKDGSTIVKAFSRAGGYNDYAQLSKVKIIREGENGEKEILKVNMKKYLEGEGDAPKLENGDIIMVPKNLKKGWSSFVTFVSQIAIIFNVVYLISQSAG